MMTEILSVYEKCDILTKLTQKWT